MKRLVLLIFILMFSCEKNKNTTDLAQGSSKNNLIAMVMINGKYGFINPEGDYIINPKYPLARSFSNGLACVNFGGMRNDLISGAIGGTYGFIDTNGKLVQEAKSYSKPVSFYNDFAVIELDNGTVGFMNRKFELVKGGFDLLMPFRDGLAAAVINNEKIVGFIDTTGEWKIKFDERHRIGDFHEGIAFLIKDNKFGYINTQGEIIIEPKYEGTYDFHEGLGAFLLNDKFGFMNKEGEHIISNEYEDVADFSEGLCAVQKNGKWGYINNTGEIVIPFNFDVVRDFHQGFAAVSQGSNKVGYIDKNGDWLVEPEFYNALDFKNGYAIINKNGKLGFINLQGEIIIEPQYERVDNFVNPFASNENLRLD